MSSYKHLGLYGVSAALLSGAFFYFAVFAQENESIKVEYLSNSEPAGGTVSRPLAMLSAELSDVTGDELAALLRSQERIMAELVVLNSRIASFESRIGDIERGSESALPSEQAIATQADEQSQQEAYERAEEEFYAQPVDPQWDAEMTMSLSGMESFIGEYSKDSVSISSQECRSGACRVEFTYSDDAPPLDPVMLAARGASRMLFDTSVEDGMGKTVVIYQR